MHRHSHKSSKPNRPHVPRLKCLRGTLPTIPEEIEKCIRLLAGWIGSSVALAKGLPHDSRKEDEPAQD